MRFKRKLSFLKLLHNKAAAMKGFIGAILGISARKTRTYASIRGFEVQT
jgi:hypothetical protein